MPDAESRRQRTRGRILDRGDRRHVVECRVAKSDDFTSMPTAAPRVNEPGATD
jgi:hypothetical protein